MALEFVLALGGKKDLDKVSCNFVESVLGPLEAHSKEKQDKLDNSTNGFGAPKSGSKGAPPKVAFEKGAQAGR
jgi:hypothetical protein